MGIQIQTTAFAARNQRTWSDMGLGERVTRKIKRAAEDNKDVAFVEVPGDRAEDLVSELETVGFDVERNGERVSIHW